MARGKKRPNTLKVRADNTINIEESDPIEAVTEMTAGKMADVVMDVTGSSAGADLALSLAGKRSTVVLPGIYKESRVALDLNRAVVNEIRLLGVFSHDFRAVRAAIELVRQKRYPFEDLISHRFKLEDAEQALRLVGGKMPGEMPLKVILNPEKGKDGV